MIRNIKLPTNLTSSFSGIPQIEDITDQLPINPSWTWEKLTGKREAAKLYTIVVHHTGMQKSLGCTAASHARSHINSKTNHPKGDPGIPYHVYINTINGPRIQQVNDLLDFTYGVANNNGYTIHIAVEGNFLVDAFTEMDRLCLYAAILAVKAAVPTAKVIKGHREITPTACPGIDMDRVRTDIQTIENQILYAQSAEHKKAVALRIGSNILWLSRLANGLNADNSPATPLNIDWAQKRLLLLEPIMESFDMLK